ncbi:hypothetical protein AB0H83_49845 [Dactylosporangium sp. NPDC050688]|uniref:hypothetical protein n=1 Tax=Dactylosporangium sp. NPDC050688 TaxID=3157217 RepID=UPI0033ECB0BA
MAFWDTAITGKLEWTIHRRCEDCEREEYAHGDGPLPEPMRTTYVDQCGLTRVSVEGAGSRPLRVRLMKVFRDDGAGLAEASSEVERLAGGGVIGTQSEMDLLAEKLRAAGAAVRLESV